MDTCMIQEKEDHNIHYGMNCGIRKTVKEGAFVPTHKINGVMVNKDNEYDYTKDE